MAACEINQNCILCPRKREKRCTGCKETLYCSTDFWLLDWQDHKHVRRLLKYFIFPLEEPPRRSLFHGAYEHTRIVRPKTEVEFWVLYEFFDVKPLFGVDRSIAEKESNMHNLIQTWDTSCSIAEYLQMEFLVDTTQALPNNTLGKASKGGVIDMSWRGTILAICFLDSNRLT